jgi:multicomponent Na+:H+ antiporter subunit E
VILTGGWWALTGGDPSGYGFGVPVVLLALAVSLRLASILPPPWSPLGVAQLILTFLGRSLVAGFDVARLALDRSRTPSPTLARYALRLPGGAARNLFMGTLNLMPGTLGVNLDGDVLEIHMLVDGGDEMLREIQDWEERVARALNQPLQVPHA